MNNPEIPRNIRQHISVQQVGTETLVYDERRHKAFCLNECSSIVFKLADGAHTVSEIRATASVELEAPISEELVLFALEELRRDGLIEPSPDATVPSLSRRALLQRLGVGGAMLMPVVAAIVAPTAAQAYSGCVDCASMAPAQTRARSRQLKATQLDPATGLAVPGSPNSGPRDGQIVPPETPEQ